MEKTVGYIALIQIMTSALGKIGTSTEGGNKNYSNVEQNTIG